MLLEINADHPEPRKIKRAVDALNAGEVIAYPTDTVYGLGCDISSKKALDRIYQMKSMDRRHPLAFLCPDLSEIARYAVVDNQIYRVLRRFLPGPYCFILEATREVPRILQTKQKTIGIRVPKHPITHAIVSELGRPVLSTSAQRPGDEDPFIDAREIDEGFHGIGLVIDAGVGGRIPATVIDLTMSPPQIVREGAGSIEDFIEEEPRSLRGVRMAMKQLERDMRD